MKKLLLLVAMVAVGFTANAQKAGFNLGADATYNFDGESFGLMAEANYLFSVSDKFRVGPAASYQYNFGSDRTVGGGTVNGVAIPEVTVSVGGNGNFTLAAAARFDVSEQFVLGADLGAYLSDGSAFYYRPLVGYKLGETSMLQLSYPASSGNGSLALGIMFGL